MILLKHKNVAKVLIPRRGWWWANTETNSRSRL